MDLDVGAILAYNALHLVLALAIGFIVAGLVGFAEQRPTQRGIARTIIVAGFIVTVVAVGLLTMPMRALIPWWSIVVANAAATLLAGAYLLARHPGLWRRLALA
jgi:protein-S-isoprenylcysteine O-methyltransferase Ste14